MIKAQELNKGYQVRHRTREMKRYIILIIYISFLLACQNRNDNVEVKPQLSDITELVYASIKISPETYYYAQPIHSGIIDKIHIQEGDLVKKGQILFEIEAPTGNEEQLIQAKINLEEAKSNYLGQNNLLNNIQLEIQTVEQQYRLDSVNLERQERLLAQGIGKRIDYDQLKLKYVNTKNQLELLYQKWEQTKTTLENNYKKAVTRIETERNQLGDFQVRSKLDGKVYSVTKEEGDFVSSQDKISEIGSYDQFKVEMDIDEVDITKIELGDSVLIILDAYPDEVFVARVSKIFSKKNDVTQTFRVESSFQQPPPKLYYGLSGEANIIVSRRENALIIPTDYLLADSKVLTDKGEKNVKTGIKNLEYVEVLSGLDTSSILIKPSE